MLKCLVIITIDFRDFLRKLRKIRPKHPKVSRASFLSIPAAILTPALAADVRVASLPSLHEASAKYYLLSCIVGRKHPEEIDEE